MYHVRATVTNCHSSLSLPVTVIQVGDNVTSVDVAVADWLVPVSAPVNLTFDVPRGWPIILTVDMGDGQPPQRITRPADYDPTTDDRLPRRSSPATTSTTTTPATPSRRRRDVDAPVEFGQPFLLTYQYRTQGSYKCVQFITSITITSCSLVDHTHVFAGAVLAQKFWGGAHCPISPFTTEAIFSVLRNRKNTNFI